MGFLNILTSYAGKWEKVGTSQLDDTEIKSVSKAEVVESTYGKSVRFTMVTGGTKFLPISTMTIARVGDQVDLNKMTIVQLHRDGEADIYRAEW